MNTLKDAKINKKILTSENITRDSLPVLIMLNERDGVRSLTGNFLKMALSLFASIYSAKFDGLGRLIKIFKYTCSLG